MQTKNNVHSIGYSITHSSNRTRYAYRWCS